ncbi:hypothetical protein FQZ97_1087500 [compost metagenome]
MNGSATVTGGTIIMPSAIRTLAITRSMIRNGMKMVKPIWKAVFSSLVMNAGTRMRMGTCVGSSMAGSLARLAKSDRSFSRVWCSMKVRKGEAARSTAVSNGIDPSESGL